MSFRSTRNPSNLSIRPPSPAAAPPPTISTPTNQMSNAQATQSLSSPRRPGPPISPSNSSTGLWSQGNSHQGSYPGSPYAGSTEDRLRGNSLDVPQSSGLGSRDKRLPAPPWITPHSPHRNKSLGAGAYDNKLVSSTLSHLPPLPSNGPSTPTLLHPRPNSPRPSTSTVNSTTSSIGVVLPDGTTLSRDTDRSTRSVADTLAHSSPSSPWSVLTVHVLPLFAGGHLKTPLEDLNHLCHSHIIATSQRTPSARIVSALTQDLREFIASGMLTLKAKFDTLEETKVISRAAEVWSFFWSQVLPYLEGVFLPLNQVRDLPAAPSQSTTTIASPPIPVRHLLLSGFLLHILLPLLPRLLPLISSSSLPPSIPELQRILQMSLVISTQARYSSIVPARENQDDQVRENVESLGRAVRWRIQHGDPAEPIVESRVQRGLSISGRRRKGVRSSAMPRELGFPEIMDEDDDPTPNQSYAGGPQAEWSGGVSQSTVIASLG